MTFVNSAGVRLYTESTGSGESILFVHEFGGDLKTWERQVRYMARRYRCITFNARGYPPSDVPEDIEQYSQSLAVEDIANVARHFGLDRIHLVGCSMGAYSALNYAFAHPETVASLVLVGAGHGSDPVTREQFLEHGAAFADAILKQGLQQIVGNPATSQTRRRYHEKDPRGYEEASRQFAALSALGCSLTFRGCQLRRPTLYELEDQIRRLRMPTLIVAGDDDEMCLDPALFLKRCIPDARLWIAPRTTHSVNLEEAEQFNRIVSDFIAEIQHGR